MVIPNTQTYLKDLLYISAASLSNLSITHLLIPPSSLPPLLNQARIAETLRFSEDLLDTVRSDGVVMAMALSPVIHHH